MGWDAYTDTKNKRALAAFNKAADKVCRIAGSVDGLLAKGGLDCSTCATELEDATGHSVYCEYPWSIEMVKVLNKKARWPRKADIEPGREWAVYSAKEFLRVCATYNLSIRFSW